VFPTFRKCPNTQLRGKFGSLRAVVNQPEYEVNPGVYEFSRSPRATQKFRVPEGRNASAMLRAHKY